MEIGNESKLSLWDVKCQIGDSCITLNILRTTKCTLELDEFHDI